MADFAFTSERLVLPGWQPIGRCGDRVISVDMSRPTPHPCTHVVRHGICCVVLSQVSTAQDVLEAIAELGTNFVDGLRVAAGMVIHLETGEFCVFRDPFGFIPMLVTLDEDGGVSAVTSSPDVHAQSVAGRPLNRAWMARFLLNSQASDVDDVWQNTERIFPGESRFYTQYSAQKFCRDVLDGSSDNKTWSKKRLTFESNQYWKRRHYKPLAMTTAEYAEALRQHIVSAVDKIPASNPYFTLSGGLDSSGIVASYLLHHHDEPVVHAVSLVSRRHAQCDESPQLDELERAFPTLCLRRVVMDDAWALSQPEINAPFAGYGPLSSPGIESVLEGYRAIERECGPQTIITGYGGNFLVTVRPEALWRELWQHHRFAALLSELDALSPDTVLSMIKRFLGNAGHGFLSPWFKKVLSHHSRRHAHRAESWVNPSLLCLVPREDPVYALTHIEERAWLPLSNDWEMHVRCLDVIARLVPHRFYDPLFEPELYDFCAQIPPREFLRQGRYRDLYIRALSPLLPRAILEHPKTQCFDDLFLDGLCVRAKSECLELVHHAPREWLIPERLFQSYQAFSDTSPMAPRVGLMPVWRALSASLFCRRYHL